MCLSWLRFELIYPRSSRDWLRTFKYYPTKLFKTIAVYYNPYLKSLLGATIYASIYNTNRIRRRNGHAFACVEATYKVQMSTVLSQSVQNPLPLAVQMAPAGTRDVMFGETQLEVRLSSLLVRKEL